MGIMYHGKPIANQVYCCGVIGITHKYNATDTAGTDFMLALAYGWKDSGGCCIAVNCGASNKYCVGAEEEENNDLYDYGTSLLENAVVVTQFDPTPNAVTTYLNGTKVLTHSPPKAKLNAGTAIHLGGGGHGVGDVAAHSLAVMGGDNQDGHVRSLPLHCAACRQARPRSSP